MNPASPHETPASSDLDRRGFLGTVSGGLMAVGLISGYGAFAAVAARFMYPARPRRTGWMFVRELAALPAGSSVTYRSPIGETVAIARTGAGSMADDFIALSSVCPHLGCQVHWESPHQRFFCPCHNGTFDPSGQATGGPPGEAGQSLPRYPLKVEGGSLYIEVPLDSVG